MLDIIINTFKTYGYEEVSANIWNDVRIYVNITNRLSFSYDLSDNFSISSAKLLPPKEFGIAKKLIRELKAYSKKEV